jgi:hypothetical protein
MSIVPIYVSSLLKNKTDNHEDSSFSVPSSLKNKIDPPPIKSSLSLDLVNVDSSISLDLVNIESSFFLDLVNIDLSLSLYLVTEPSFLLLMSNDPLSSSPSSEPFPTSSQKSDWVLKKSQRTKQSLGACLQPLDVMLELCR